MDDLVAALSHADNLARDVAVLQAALEQQRQANAELQAALELTASLMQHEVQRRLDSERRAEIISAESAGWQTRFYVARRAQLTAEAQLEETELALRLARAEVDKMTDELEALMAHIGGDTPNL